MKEEERLSNLRFIVDCMHGKLARKMRIYGFDTKYDITLEDNKIIEIAKDEGRTIITSDEELISRAKAENLQVIRVPLDDDLPRMIKIFRELRILPEIDPKRSRCPNCNSQLAIVDKKEIQNIPEKVLKRKKIFYKCNGCGKVYWYGSHWKKIKEFEKTLKRRLKELKDGEKNLNLTDEDGKLLVELARKAIEEYVINRRKYDPPEEIKKKFSEKAGVFVTINRVVEGEKELRGCIGFPEAILPLYEAVVEAAIAAAVEDPRFEPLSKRELDEILVEVSVLTPLQLIKVDSPLQYPDKIKVGEDGLMLKWIWGSGLLLPQVAVEYGWDAREFLENLCLKAGITPDSWLRKDVKIYKFQCLIWEEKGKGEVIRKNLSPEK